MTTQLKWGLAERKAMKELEDRRKAVAEPLHRLLNVHCVTHHTSTFTALSENADEFIAALEPFRKEPS